MLTVVLAIASRTEHATLCSPHVQVVLLPPVDVLRARLEARWKTGQQFAAFAGHTGYLHIPWTRQRRMRVQP
jgi:hypothetical protein